MARELFQVEANGTISFGDYTLAEKTKKSDIPYEGDLYKVKTFKEITKLERNGLFVYESVPGTAVTAYKETAEEVAFEVTGTTGTQITLGMEENTTYEIYINAEKVNDAKTQLGGKLSISVEASETPVTVKVVKC